MLANLINKHAGGTIAVVGSSPTATHFRPEQGVVSIAVNGAAALGYAFDYFMCGDVLSPQRDWFTINCARIRVIARIIATMDHKLYPTDLYPQLFRRVVPAHQQSKLRNIPDPVEPHLTYRYSAYRPGKLSQNQKTLMYGGTISGCAAQLANIMGAKEIHLYGCSFENYRDQYFYKTAAKGKIFDTMVATMDQILAELRNRGTKVICHGATKLTSLDKVCKHL